MFSEINTQKGLPEYEAVQKELEYIETKWPVGKEFDYHGTKMIVEFSDHEDRGNKLYWLGQPDVLPLNKSKIKASYKGDNGEIISIKLKIPILKLLENGSKMKEDIEHETVK